MQTPLPTISAMMLIAACAYAGPETIIYQRAKELRDQNNVRQGIAPPTQAPPTPGVPAAPTLTISLVKFQTELGALNMGTPATAVQKQQLTQNLALTAQGAKPSQALLTKLTEDLTAAYAEKPLAASSRARLVQELDAVLNPAKYPNAKLDGIFKDIQAIFQDNGLSRSKAVTISEDVKAISAQIQKGGA